MKHEQAIELFELVGKRVDVCSDRISQLCQVVDIHKDRINEIEEKVNLIEEILTQTTSAMAKMANRINKLENKPDINMPLGG